MAAEARKQVAVIGSGPAGLMAAEVISAAGHAVTVYERMPSPARKLLMAGGGGLNLTHSEPLPAFLARYGAAEARLRPIIEAFSPEALVAWCHELGQETFVGSSGRVFPKAMKASPLLRAWLRRLQAQGVVLALGCRWGGWDAAGSLTFTDASGADVRVRADATVLALGGASWPRLGSDGGWVEVLRGRGVRVADLRPANCGIDIGWTQHFRSRFAGAPLKRIALSFADRTVKGEAMVTESGLESGAVYALAAALRDAIAAQGPAELAIDLRPDLGEEELARRLDRPRGKQSTGNFLRKSAGLVPVAAGLMREGGRLALPADPRALAKLIKSVPLTVTAVQPIERAISSAGGILWDELDGQLMLSRLPGVFAAGEMLDWEAPTGGYLLQACMATGAAAGKGAAGWVSGEQKAGCPVQV